MRRAETWGRKGPVDATTLRPFFEPINGPDPIRAGHPGKVQKMRNTVKQSRAAVAAALMMLPWTMGTAHAVDIHPGDYTVLPEGTNLALAYGVHISADDLEVGGTTVPDSSLQATFTMLRYVRFEKIGDLPVLAEAILPIGGYHNVKIGGAPQPVKNGLGDLILAVAAFPIHSPATTLGFTAYLTVPTGAYDPAKISFGTNSYTFTPQVGLIQKLGEGLFLDAAADVALATSHSEGGLRYSTAPSYQVQAYIRKALDATTSLSFGYSGRFGGRQKVDGADIGLKTNSHQIRAFAGKFVTKTLQVQLMAGADIASNDGFRQGFQGQLRLLKLF